MACAIRSPQEYCDNFETAAPSAGYAAWTMYKVEDIVGINKAVVTSGNTAVIYYQIPKVIVDSVTVSLGNLSQLTEGCQVYFDSATNAITDVSGGNTLCGIVTATPVVGAVLIEIHLMGALAL